MVVYLLLGIIIMLGAKFFEQKYSAKKIYIKFSNYISINEDGNLTISEKTINKSNVDLLNEMIGRNNYIFLIVREKFGIKVQSLNNEKKRELSQTQYESLVKKLKMQNPFYTYNIDTSSIYYRFNSPYEDYILWIYL
jgi:hypothetical protein